jgi:hypothetical protein
MVTLSMLGHIVYTLKYDNLRCERYFSGKGHINLNNSLKRDISGKIVLDI